MINLELHIIKMYISSYTQDPVFLILVIVDALMFLNVLSNLIIFQNICETIGLASILLFYR